MSAYTMLINNLEHLKLFQMKKHIDSYIDMVTAGNKTMVEALSELTKLEIELKELK